MDNHFYDKRLIIIISSPSGTGKTSICNKLLKRDKRLRLSISHTTRLPRKNEKNGKDYFFIKKNDFKKRVSQNYFLEHASVFDNYYGSSFEYVNNLLDNKYDVLFDIDWQGAKQINKNKNYNITSIFLTPPTKDEVIRRLKKRSIETGDDIFSIDKRMAEFENEMSHKDDYKFVLVNKEINRCVHDVEKIIESERLNLKKISS